MDVLPSQAVKQPPMGPSGDQRFAFRSTSTNAFADSARERHGAGANSRLHSTHRQMSRTVPSVRPGSVSW